MLKQFSINLLWKLRRKRSVVFIFLLILIILKLSWPLSRLTSKALLPPTMTKDLDHLRRNRSLSHYLDNIQLLIEPSASPCENLEEVPVIMLVCSAPSHVAHRMAVRNTWGEHLPTYFIIGLNGQDPNEFLIDNYMEAKQFSDLIVYDFYDHYQNLTLKTALTMQWTLKQCPQADFLFKIDDDVLVNPWTLKRVLKENRDAKLLGYKRENVYAHRDIHSKWYLPRWLWYEDLIPEYLAGSGYLINGDNIKQILNTAYKLPMINLEDIFFTYLVARNTLHYQLTDDKRLNHYKPVMPLGCVYWGLAAAHSLEPNEMVNIWLKIKRLSEKEDVDERCSFYNRFLLSDKLFY